MSIPRIIHFGAFGSWQMTELDKKCIQTWRDILPDYELRFWNDYNGPQTPWFKCAINSRPINAHNYVKWWALWKYGGVFLDNDVEVLKPFDLSHEAFIAFQRDDTKQDCINSAVVGSEEGHWFVKACLDRVERDNNGDDAWPVVFGCGIPTLELYGAGMQGLNVEQDVKGVHVYTKDSFYPWRHDEAPDCMRVNEKTFAIHRWEASWKK